MKIIGFVMMCIPLVVWFVWCGKDLGFRRAVRLFGWVIGILLGTFGWYLLAWHFIGGKP